MSTPERALSVLVVCMGNICRSPTGEAALVEAARELGLPLEVASAGTGDWHVGHPPDPRMVDAASAVGLELSGTAELVDAQRLEAADLVLAMDAANLRDLERLAGSTGITTPIRRFREFDPEAHGDLDVADPYHGGPDGFADVVATCRRTARALVGILLEEPGGVLGRAD